MLDTSARLILTTLLVEPLLGSGQGRQRPSLGVVRLHGALQHGATDGTRCNMLDNKIKITGEV